MREIIKIVGGALILAAGFNSTAQEGMVDYTLDAKEQIFGCKIIALKKTADLGKVESITGSKLNLRIDPENAYKVTINEEKVFYLQYEAHTGFAEVNGIKVTKERELDYWAITSDEASKNEPGLSYRIQIGAFSNHISTAPFKHLGQLYTEEIDGGLTRYMIGSFDSQDDAVRAMSKIKDAGYSTAFTVICHNGRRISRQEARTIHQQPSSLTFN